MLLEVFSYANVLVACWLFAGGQLARRPLRLSSKRLGFLQRVCNPKNSLSETSLSYLVGLCLADRQLLLSLHSMKSIAFYINLKQLPSDRRAHQF